MSDSSKRLEKPYFCREIRLGLVVYGGVSLAIYMNGVCREFYNAVRGRGIYKLIKALRDSDIVVDIISGTSAGGINGVLLSYAIANSNKENIVDFKNFAQIWRENGDINKLLHQPDINEYKDNVDSVLDGSGYYQDALADAFQTAINLAEKSTNKDEWYSDFKELDLFVTGTDMLGRIYKAFDQTGKEIEIKDHRSVFHLRHRQDRMEKVGEPFGKESTNHKALAKLCRITSCFPLAFPVVTVKLDSIPGDTESQVDQKLVEWGQLMKNRELPPKELTEKKQHQLYFVDGGVLDNRPFSYTINEIYCRLAYRPVDRKLFYIDPAPDSFLGSQQFKKMPKPDIGKIMTASLTTLPRYQSIGKDLERIKALNEKVGYYRMLRETLEEEAHNPDNNDDSNNLYLRCRLVALRDRIINRIANIKQEFVLSENTTKIAELETAIKLLNPYPSQVEYEKIKKVGKESQNFDVQYFFRKYYFLASKIGSIVRSIQSKNTLNVNNQLYWKLQRISYIFSWHSELLKLTQIAINKTIENILKADSESELKQFKLGVEKESAETLYLFLLNIQKNLLLEENYDNWGEWQEKMRSIPTGRDDFLNYINDPIKGTDLTNEINELIEKIKYESVCKFDVYESSDQRTILNNIDAFLKELLVQNQNEPEIQDIINTFDDFEDIDQKLYPCEYLSGIQTKNTIDLQRISPNDAQLGLGKDKTMNEKLAGDQFRAFAGFFKKPWRSNDILWGRLDGLNRLVESLVTPDFVETFKFVVEREVPESPEYDTLFKRKEYISQLVDESVKEPELKQKIEDYLIQVFVSESKQIDPEQFNTFVNNLVLAGQQDIIDTDLEVVLKDVEEQRQEWNQTGEPLPELGNKTTQEKVEYFTKSYKIGLETLKEGIPPEVRSRWIATSLFNFRDILVSWKGEKILKNPVLSLSIRLLKIINGQIGQTSKINQFFKVLLLLVFVILSIVSFVNLVKVAPLITVVLLLSLVLSLVMLLLVFLSNFVLRK